MPQTEWRLKGDWIKNCNCAFGCPCDFNARPTDGNCKGLVGMRITDGHFGDVRLDGVNFCATVDFPGPLHEGNGTLQAIIDERATPAQREALFGILSGQNSAEGTIFRIFSLIVTKMLDPIFAPIRFDFDLPGRRAKISIPGILETENEPICNPVTGAPHRIQIDAGRVRAPQRRGMQFADREHRRDQVQRAARARLTRHSGADA
jgi:hypothetical protein